MTPREKAYKICDDLCWAMGYGNLEKEVKAAALFTVDEILDELKPFFVFKDVDGVSSLLLEEIFLREHYWKEVKKEIDEL